MRPAVPRGGSLPPPTFKNLVTELASTALVCLGVLDSPIAKQKVVDLARAKHLIGMLAMLRQKSHGNLEPMEADYLDAVIEDLEEKYRIAAPEEPDEPDEP